MAYDHSDLEVGSVCEECGVYIHNNPDTSDDYWFEEYRNSHCQGDSATPHDPYVCGQCMDDCCKKEGMSVNGFDPYVKEQYFTNDASMEEHDKEHDYHYFGDIHHVSPMSSFDEVPDFILKLLKYGALTEKGNPRRRRKR